MSDVLKQFIFYFVCIAICIAGGICGFKVYQNATSRSHNVGKAEYIDIYEDFNVLDFDVPDPTFYNNNNSRRLTYNVLKAFEFDGTENKYNLLINNEPCNYTVSSYGILTGEFIKSFYNLYNEKIATLTFNITFEFYNDYTEFYIDLDCSDEDYSLLLKYLKKNGLKVRLIEEQYNSSQDDTISNNIWVKFVNSNNELIDMRNITKGSNISDFTYSAPTGYDVVYKINNSVINLDSYNFTKNTTVVVELVKQKFTITFKTDKNLTISSSSYDYGTTLTQPNINIVGYDFELQEELTPVTENKTYTFTSTLKEGFRALENIVLTKDNNSVTLVGVNSNYNFYAVGYFSSSNDMGIVGPSFNLNQNLKIPYDMQFVSLSYENNIITFNTSLNGSLTLMYITEDLHRIVSYYDKDEQLLQSYNYLASEEIPTHIAPTIEDYEFIEWQVKEQTDNSIKYIATYQKIDITYTINYKVYGKGYSYNSSVETLIKDTTNNWVTIYYDTSTTSANPMFGPTYSLSLKGSCKYKTPIGVQSVTNVYYAPNGTNALTSGYTYGEIELAGTTFVGFSTTQDKSGLIDQSTWYPTANTTLYLIYE